MMTGERRPLSVRRGMTVLGKIPAVPKPINLPSQRLENGGLDVNVMIVPRGSVSWGAGSRSPAIGSPWGNSGHYSSPTTAANSCDGPSVPSTRIAIADSWGSWRGQTPGASSTGTGTCPSSAGSLCQHQETATVPSAWTPEACRPSSASGVLGRAQSQPSISRPRSAETRTSDSQAPPSLTRYADPTDSTLVSLSGNRRNAVRKLDEASHQAAQFMLTGVDFPTLGSEKNPDLRPQLNKIGCTPSERTAPVGERIPPAGERPRLGPSAAFELPPPLYNTNGGRETRQEGWRRDARPYGSRAGGAEENCRGDDPPRIPSVCQSPVTNAWQGEGGNGAASAVGRSDDKWRRAAPPVVPRGPPCSGRFQSQQSNSALRQRNGPLPGLSGRAGGPASGGYRRHDINGCSASSERAKETPARPGLAVEPVICEGLGLSDTSHGSRYGNIFEQENTDVGIHGRPGAHLNLLPGHVVGTFSRYSHGDPRPVSQHHPNDTDMYVGRSEPMGYERQGHRDRIKSKEFTANGSHGRETRKEGREAGHTSLYQNSREERRLGHLDCYGWKSELLTPCPRGSRLGSHRDWGAAVCSDEPMDFSKPVFEEDTSSGLASKAKRVFNLETRVGVDGLDSVQANCDGEPEVRISGRHSRKAADLSANTKPGFDGITNAESVVLQPFHPGDECQDDHLPTGVQKVEKSGIPVLESRVRDISSPITIQSPITSHHVLQTNGSGKLSDAVNDDHWTKDGKLSARTMGERRSEGEELCWLHETAAGSVKQSSTPLTSLDKAASPSKAGRSLQVMDGPSVRPSTVGAFEGSLCYSCCNEDISKDGLSTRDLRLSSDSDKHLQFSSSGNSSSPSRLDEQKRSDELCTFKLVGDGSMCGTLGGTVNGSEILESRDFVVGTSTGLHVTNDVKLKSKAGDSDIGEKEWRPKCLPGISVNLDIVESAFALSRKQSLSQVTTAVVSESTVAAERAGFHLGNPNGTESYDYEAQRARMKEISTQRAILLRREENERIKGQKAKASAKLEELNRRSLEVSTLKSAEKPSPNKGDNMPPIPDNCFQGNTNLVPDVGTDSFSYQTTSSGSEENWPKGICNGRNDYGKRERVGVHKGKEHHRDEQGMEMDAGIHYHTAVAKLTLSPSNQMKVESRFLPSYPEKLAPQALSPYSRGNEVSVSIPGPSAEIAVEPSEGAGHTRPQARQQEPTSRGKQPSSQLKHGVKHFKASVELESPTQARETAPGEISRNKGFFIESVPSVNRDSEELTKIANEVLINREGALAGRKKKAKTSGRSKHKLGAFCASTDLVKPTTGSMTNLSSLNNWTDAGVSTCAEGLKLGAPDARKTVTSLVVSDEGLSQGSSCEAAVVEHGGAVQTAGTDVVPGKSSGGLFKRNPQRKSQSAPHALRKKEKGYSQDVRLGDKPLGGDGMIWTPVKLMQASHPADPKAGFRSDRVGSRGSARERKEESVAPQTRHARRAELERYIPKLVVKQQAHEEQMRQEKGSSIFQKGGRNLQIRGID